MKATTRGVLGSLALTALVLVSGAGVNQASSTPDPSRTRGATDPALTEATAATTICAPGYVDGALAVTLDQRRRVFARYHIARAKQDGYLIDHLVPAELGGSNTTPNLWPQPKTQVRAKNAVEREFRTLVCSGQLDLVAAQYAIQKDWRSARQAVQPLVDAQRATLGQYLAAVALDDEKRRIADYLASFAATTTTAPSADETTDAGEASPPETTPPRPPPTQGPIFEGTQCHVPGQTGKSFDVTPRPVTCTLAPDGTYRWLYD